MEIFHSRKTFNRFRRFFFFANRLANCENNLHNSLMHYVARHLRFPFFFFSFFPHPFFFRSIVTRVRKIFFPANNRALYFCLSTNIGELRLAARIESLSREQQRCVAPRDSLCSISDDFEIVISKGEKSRRERGCTFHSFVFFPVRIARYLVRISQRVPWTRDASQQIIKLFEKEQLLDVIADHLPYTQFSLTRASRSLWPW